MADAAYIDIEKLKVKPKLSPSDFSSLEGFFAYVEARLDSIMKLIDELEGNMVFLSERSSPSEVHRAANSSLEIIADIRTEASK